MTSWYQKPKLAMHHNVNRDHYPRQTDILRISPLFPYYNSYGAQRLLPSGVSYIVPGEKGMQSLKMGPSWPHNPPPLWHCKNPSFESSPNSTCSPFWERMRFGGFDLRYPAVHSSLTESDSPLIFTWNNLTIAILEWMWMISLVNVERVMPFFLLLVFFILSPSLLFLLLLSLSLLYLLFLFFSSSFFHGKPLISS